MNIEKVQAKLNRYIGIRNLAREKLKNTRTDAAIRALEMSSVLVYIYRRRVAAERAFARAAAAYKTTRLETRPWTDPGEDWRHVHSAERID